ncbi:MAG TPA: hypothetical protein VEX39_18365 [Thermoleophilaceae bacterium]|nr:hypothetical protein [Thermoleophilaceae bacterium]
MAERDDTTQGLLDRFVPRIGPLEAVRRHKLLAVMPTIVFLALALLYTQQRTPIYTAEARQTIGRIDVSAPGALAGFSSATRALASSYSRAIVAPEVVEPVARRTGLSPALVRARLSATPIPESAVIAVTGIGPTKADAIAVAGQGARALESYVARLNRSNPNGDRLFKEFRRASLRQSRLKDRLAELQRRPDGSLSAADREQLSQVREEVAAADLSVLVAKENYAISRRSESNVSILQTISVPQTASSDKGERAQLALFVALIAGILVGIALASLRANLAVRHAFAAQ